MAMGGLAYIVDIDLLCKNNCARRRRSETVSATVGPARSTAATSPTTAVIRPLAGHCGAPSTRTIVGVSLTFTLTVWLLTAAGVAVPLADPAVSVTVVAEETAPGNASA